MNTKKTKVYELTLEDGAEGVFAISLVDRPAIGENFIAFSKINKIEFKELPNGGNTLVGAVLIPDLLIDRVDAKGEVFQVYMSGETIKQTAHNYLKRGLQSASTLQHKADIDGVTVVETWLKEDNEKDKSLMYGFDLPINTWFVKMAVDNPEIKEAIKNGSVKGFSIEGLFEQKIELKEELIINNNHMKYKKPLNKIMAALSLEVKLEQVSLIDGVTILEAEAFEPGYSIGIVTEEGIVPAPAGEYETTEGKMISVVTDGIIETCTDKEAAKEDESIVEEEMNKEVPAAGATPKKIVDIVTRETFFAEVEKEILEMEVKFTEEKGILEAEISRLKTELSEAAAPAIVHNPEPKQATKTLAELSSLEAHKIFRKQQKQQNK